MPGKRTGEAARARSTVLRYFSDRHARGEKLTLERFGLSGRSHGKSRFWLEVIRAADDLKPAELYVGTGAITCRLPPAIAAWAIAPNTQPSLPAPQSFADSCRLVASWCEPGPHPGAIPDPLRRPLALPSVDPGGRCPTSRGHAFNNGQFAGIALGDGPIEPLISGGGTNASHGILVFRPYAVGLRGWYRVKTLWFSLPNYQGPVYIRGRQLDGPHTPVFGENPQLVDPQIPPEPTLNGSGGWREWPGGTWLRTPGCYAWQIDGTEFSKVVVFQAVFTPVAR